MDFAYLITPVLTWMVVGPIKFLITSVRQRRWAFNLVGNGGFPSNHSSVVSSMATLIALREGIGHPAFGVAVTLAFIVMIDANSLRQHGPPGGGDQQAGVRHCRAHRPARAHGPYPGGDRRRHRHRYRDGLPDPRHLRLKKGAFQSA